MRLVCNTGMSELDAVRRDINELTLARGRLESGVETLSDTVTVLAASVEKLTASLNQGRGALWAITVGAGAVGAIIPTFIGWLAHR